MPIRFRCAYCNQLMGIARRKAGTVVHCPKCKGQVVVPTPEGVSEESAASELPPVVGPEAAANGGGPFAAAVFERSDFEKVFEPVGHHSPQALQQATVRPGPAAPLIDPQLASLPTAGATLDKRAEKTAGRGILLTPGMLALVCGLGVILMGLAFFLGLLLGRSGSG